MAQTFSSGYVLAGLGQPGEETCMSKSNTNFSLRPMYGAQNVSDLSE
jgi:hypothetical protein